MTEPTVTSASEGTDADTPATPRVASEPSDARACCGGAVSRLSSTDADRLAHRLAAAADPVRLHMLSILAEAPGGEVCACDFVEPVERSQPTVSHHLKVLAEAGLVSGERRGRWIWYRLADHGVDDLLRSFAAAVR